MNFYEAITKINTLSSYETSKEKREEYKECINAILEEHSKLQKYENIMYEPIQLLIHKIDVLYILLKNTSLYENTLMINMDSYKNADDFEKVKRLIRNENIKTI